MSFLKNVYLCTASYVIEKYALESLVLIKNNNRVPPMLTLAGEILWGVKTSSTFGKGKLQLESFPKWENHNMHNFSKDQ